MVKVRIQLTAGTAEAETAPVFFWFSRFQCPKFSYPYSMSTYICIYIYIYTCIDMCIVCVYIYIYIHLFIYVYLGFFVYLSPTIPE